MNHNRKLTVAIVLLAFLAGLLLILGDKVEMDAEVRAAFDEYRSCMKSDVFCVPADPCPHRNCMSEYLRRSEEINRRYFLLSILERRNLLSGWHP